MKMRAIFAAALCAAISLAASNAAPAESLAGQVGDKKRRMVIPPNSSGGCGKVYKDYVAASGHSAYASTRIGGEYFFCGATFNVGSQKSAEAGALKSCKSAVAKYKLRSIGPCEIVASK